MRSAWYPIGMRSLVVVAFVLVAGCAESQQSQGARKQFRELTQQQRPTFQSSGDFVSVSGSPDTGIFGPGDPTHDCSTCVAR